MDEDQVRRERLDRDAPKPGESDSGADPDDPWAWARSDKTTGGTDTSGCWVTAVLVTRNADDWLDETLTALAALSRRPDRVIAIDNESADNTRVLLDAAMERGEIDTVCSGRHSHGFGDAVADALAQDHRHPAEPAGSDSASADKSSDSWLWLLHDDATPAPDALAELLIHVVDDPRVDVTGPKLLHPTRQDRPQHISEIGVTVARSGRRELGLEPDEVDQGQHDQPARRLGVSSCGMLVRHSVWNALDGLDPAMPVFRDGVEFGWRAQLAGHTVCTTPAATMVHRQVGRAGLRSGGVAGSRPEKLDRELGMTLVAAHASRAALPFTWLRLLLGCLVRAVGYLLGKVPRRSRDELAAAWSFARHPRRIAQLRGRVRRLDRNPDGKAAVAALRPAPGSGMRIGLERLAAGISNRYRALAGDSHDISLDELTSDDQSSAAVESRRNPWMAPIVMVTVAAVIGCLVAARGLLSPGSLTSPYLLPSGNDLAGIWHQFLTAIPGASQDAAAGWLGVAAVGSTVFFGQPEWFVSAVLIGAVPLSMLTVYPLLLRTIDNHRIRVWAAVGYGLLPPLLGATNQGRLALSIAAVLSPLLVLAARAVLLRPPARPHAWRGGWAAGLILIVLGSFQPVLILFAALLAVIAGCTIARTWRKIARLAIAILLPIVVLAPWWPAVIRNWGRLMTGPDPGLNDSGPPGPSWQLLAGRVFAPGAAGAGGLPPLWLAAIVFGSFWLVALVGLFRSAHRPAVRAGWLIALLGLATAFGISRLVVATPPDGAESRPDGGVFLLIAFGALIIAGGIGVDGITAELSRRSFSLRQPLSAITAVLIGLAATSGAAWWIAHGATGPIARTQMEALPAYIADAQNGPKAVRTLAIDLSKPDARYTVLEGPDVRLGDAERGYAFGGSDQARDHVSSVVARLVAGTGDADIADELADLGINYVWVSGSADKQRVGISNTLGLNDASGSDTGQVWQLDQDTARVRLSSGQHNTALANRSGVRVPASSQDRTLHLGMPADPRWRATLDGRPLAPVQGGGWQQSFRMPHHGGVLRFQLHSAFSWLPIGQGVITLVAIVLAAPAIRRPELRDPMRYARQAATADSTPTVRHCPDAAGPDDIREPDDAIRPDDTDGPGDAGTPDHAGTHDHAHPRDQAGTRDHARPRDQAGTRDDVAGTDGEPPAAGQVEAERVDVAREVSS